MSVSEPIASVQPDYQGARPISAKARRRSWGEPAVRSWWLLAVALLVVTSWILIEQSLEIRSSRWRIANWHLIPNARIEKIGDTVRDTYRPQLDILVVSETTLSYVTADGQKRELKGKLKAQNRPVRPTAGHSRLRINART